MQDGIFTGKKTFISKRDAMTRKHPYKIRAVKPTRLSNTNLFTANIVYSTAKLVINMIVEYSNPVELI